MVRTDMLDEYCKWQQDSEELIGRWTILARPPRLSSPQIVLWTSRSEQERHVVIGWSNPKFRSCWGEFIHRAIRDACVEDFDVWKYQSKWMSEFFEQYFAQTDEFAILNLVTITPSRVPSERWPVERGTELRERLDLVPRLFQIGDTVRLRHLVQPFDLPKEKLQWMDRPDAERHRLQLGMTTANRMFKLRPAGMYQRLFLVDLAVDNETLDKGAVPGVGSNVIQTASGVRVHAPMIQFWRLYPTGVVDIVNVETARSSGRVIGVRCTSQRFADILRQDPYFGAAMLEFDRQMKGRRIS